VPLNQFPTLTFADTVVVRTIWTYGVPAQCGQAQQVCLYDDQWNELACVPLPNGNSATAINIGGVAHLDAYACGGRLGRIVFDDDGDNDCDGGSDDDDGGGGCGPGCWIPPVVVGVAALATLALFALCLLAPAPAVMVPAAVPLLPHHHHHHHGHPTTILFDDGHF
jgi:hypothetical protein